MGDNISESSADQHPVPVAEKCLLTPETQEENDECYKSSTQNIHVDGQLELRGQLCPLTSNVLLPVVSMHDNIIQGQDQILSDINERVHAPAQNFSNTESECHEENLSTENSLQHVLINQDKQINGLQSHYKRLKGECDKSAEEYNTETDDQEEINRTLLGFKNDQQTEVEQVETGLQKDIEGEFSYTDNKVESDAKLLGSKNKQFYSRKLLETNNLRKIGTGQKHRDNDSEEGEFVSLDSLHQTENKSLILSRNAYGHEMHRKDLKCEHVEARETVKETPKHSKTESIARNHHALSECEAAETHCDEIVSAAFSSRIRDEKGETGKDIHADCSLTESENNRCTAIREDTFKADCDSVHEEHRRNSVKDDDNIMKETKVLQNEFDQNNCHNMPEIANTLKDDEMPIQYLASQTEGAPKDESKQIEITKTLLKIPSHVVKKDAVTFNPVDKEPNVAFPGTINDVGKNGGSYDDTKSYTQTKAEFKIENGKSKDSSENDKNLVGNKNVYNIDRDTVYAKDSNEKVGQTQYDDRFNVKCIENVTSSIQNIDSKAVGQSSVANNSEYQAKGYGEDNKESDLNKENNSSITTVGDEVHLKDLHTIELADTLKTKVLESENAPKCVGKQLENHREEYNLKITHELKGENENVELNEKGICEKEMSDYERTVVDAIQGFGEADRDLTGKGIKRFLSRVPTEHPETLHKCLENTDSGISELECDQSPPAACIDSQMESQNNTGQNTENNMIPSLDDLLKDKHIKEKGLFSPRVKFSEVFRKWLHKEKHQTLTATNKHVQALLKRCLLRKKYKPFKQFCPANDVNVCPGMPKSDAYKTGYNKQIVVAQAEQQGYVLNTSDKDVMKLEYAGKESINQKREINSQMLNRMKKAMKSLAETKKLRHTAAVELKINEKKERGSPNGISDTSAFKQAISIEPLLSKPATPETYKCFDETGFTFSPEKKRQFPTLYQPRFEKSVSESSKGEVSEDTVFKLIRARQHIAAFEEKANAKVMLPVSKVPDRILRKVKAKRKCSPSENLKDIHPSAQQNVHVTGKPKNVYIINLNNYCPENNTKNNHEINTDKQPRYKDSEKLISRTFQNSALENRSSKTEMPTVSTASPQNKHSTSCIVTTENQRRVTKRVNFDSCITIHDSDSDEEVRGSDTENSKRETLIGLAGKVKMRTNKNIHKNNISNLKIGKKMSEGNVNKSRLGKPREEETQRKETISEVGNSISKCAKERLLVKLPSLRRKRFVPLYDSTKQKEKINESESKGLIVEGTVSPVQLTKQAVSVDRDETTHGRQPDTDVGTNRRNPKRKTVKGSNTCLKRPCNALQIDVRGSQSKENMMEFVADKLRAIEKSTDQPLPKKQPTSLNIQVKGPEAEIIQISSDDSDIGDESIIESCNNSDESRNKQADAAGEIIIESSESSEESESEQDNNGAYEELDDLGVYDDDYYDYEKEEVQRKRGKKCTAASSCYVVLTKLTCIRHQNERVHIKHLENVEYCSTKCRKLFLKKYVNCTY